MPTILNEQAQWRDDTNVPVNEREDAIETPESADSPALMALLVSRFIQKFANRSRYLKQQLEQLLGSSGSIDNLPDVDPTGKTPGSVLTFDGTGIIYEPPVEGVNILQNGSSILPEELADDDRTFENGIGSWVNETGTTLTQTNVLVRSGTQALRIETTATGDVIFTTTTGTSGYPITAGTVKLVEGYLRNQATARVFELAIRFYNAAGTFLSEVSSADVSANNAQWFQATFEATAPIDLNDSNNSAAYYALAFTIKGVTTTGEFHYVDDISVKGVLKPRKFLDVLGTQVTDDPAANALRLGSLSNTYKPITADTVAQSGDNTATYVIDATAGNIIITLPNGFDDGYKITLQRIDNTDNTVTFNVLGTVDSASVTAEVNGLFAGLQAIHKGGDEWLFLPFSGGALGELKAALPDGSSPFNSGVSLPYDGSYHLKADYPKYKPVMIPDGIKAFLEPENWEFIAHSTDTADGQIDPAVSGYSNSNNYSMFYWRMYDPVNGVFVLSPQDDTRYDFDYFLRSTDDGETWQTVAHGLPLPSNVAYGYRFCMIEDVIFAWNPLEGTLHRSEDYGDTWIDLSTKPGVPDLTTSLTFESPNTAYNEMAADSYLCGTKTLIGTIAYNGSARVVYYTANLGETWFQGTTPTNNDMLYFKNGAFFIWNSTAAPWVRYSTDLLTWTGLTINNENTPNNLTAVTSAPVIRGMVYDKTRGAVFCLSVVQPQGIMINMPSYGVVSDAIAQNCGGVQDVGGGELSVFDDNLVWWSQRHRSSTQTASPALPAVFNGIDKRHTLGLMAGDNELNLDNPSLQYNPVRNPRVPIVSNQLATFYPTTKHMRMNTAQIQNPHHQLAGRFYATTKYIFYFGAGAQFNPAIGNEKFSLIARCPRIGYDPDTTFFLPDWNSQVYVKVDF